MMKCGDSVLDRGGVILVGCWVQHLYRFACSHGRQKNGGGDPKRASRRPIGERDNFFGLTFAERFQYYILGKELRHLGIKRRGIL
jgi:hypothetical protein